MIMIAKRSRHAPAVFAGRTAEPPVPPAKVEAPPLPPMPPKALDSAAVPLSPAPLMTPLPPFAEPAIVCGATAGAPVPPAAPLSPWKPTFPPAAIVSGPRMYNRQPFVARMHELVAVTEV